MSLMKRFKWKAALVAVLAVSAALPALASPAAAAQSVDYSLNQYFPVDTDDHWAYFELDNFLNADLLRGYTYAPGAVELRPDHLITRAEFVAIVVRTLGLKHDGKPLPFADVKKGDWHYDVIAAAAASGIVSGVSPTKFEPNRPVARGELAAMIVRAFANTVSFAGQEKHFADVPDYYAKPYIDQASRAGIVQGASSVSFKPFNSATRAEAVVMLSRALDLEPPAAVQHEITAPLRSLFKYESELISGEKYVELRDYYERISTGFYRTSSIDYIEWLKKMNRDGYVIKSAQVSHPNDLATEVLWSTERFAALEVTGDRHKLTMDNGKIKTRLFSNDGLYMMKRMPDGKWKIYAHYEVED